MTVATTFTRSLALLTLLMASAATGNLYAVSLETQHNPVPNGCIKIDGDYSDWLSVPNYVADTTGDTAVGGLGDGVDILHGAIAHDDNFIYVLWRNAGPGGITTYSNWVWFNSWGPLQGAEYNLGGLVGWNQWLGPDGAYSGGGAGKLVAAGSTSGPGEDDFLEWSISRTALQPGGLTFSPTGGTKFEWFFIVEADTSDTYPNTHSTVWFTYDMASPVGLPGDYNQNRVVDATDYVVWRKNLGSGTSLPNDDTAGIGLDDYSR